MPSSTSVLTVDNDPVHQMFAISQVYNGPAGTKQLQHNYKLGPHLMILPVHQCNRQFWILAYSPNGTRTTRFCCGLKAPWETCTPTAFDQGCTIRWGLASWDSVLKNVVEREFEPHISGGENSVDAALARTEGLSPTMAAWLSWY